MTAKNKIIIAKGEDITFNVVEYFYNNNKCNIKFQNGVTYPYNAFNVKVLTQFKSLDSSLYTIIHDGRELFDVQDIKEFSYENGAFWQITFGNGKVSNYDKSTLEIKKSCLDDKTSADCLHYLSRMADLNDLTDDDGNKILAAQFRKVSKVNLNTVLAGYLNPTNEEVTRGKGVEKDVTPIFPFGCNSSQYTAVKNALSNNVSIIEGPPGTGKTQTILNIIANLVINGKNVQIVSNNNAATDNVLEKMSEEKFGIDFIAARLGSKANKDYFLDNQSGSYPDISDWKYAGEDDLVEKIRNLSAELGEIYSEQCELAKSKESYNSINTELEHFKKYCDEIGFDIEAIRVRKGTNPKTVLSLLRKAQTDGSLSVVSKLKALFSRVGSRKLYKKSISEIINAFRYAYYIAETESLSKNISRLSASLEGKNAAEKSKDLQTVSLILLRDYLFKKYSSLPVRTIFSKGDLLNNSDAFLKEYPVVLSTTFSALNSIGKEFDYVIIDESSQADISTGVLALCSAENAVIVGDSCQLPFVLSDEKRKIAKAIFNNYNLSENYDYSENSFLDSVKKVFISAPVTVLREHYRCEPMIIGFCNEKFYNGELIIMTEAREEGSSVSAIRTTPGEHSRGKYNQRQIEVIVQEVLPKLEYDPEDIGIIAPYNEQIKKLIEQVNDDRIKISTVHKFQGREKKVIIFCTVDNQIKEFVDDPKLLNVAVSRAEDKFIIVTGTDAGDGNISDLVSYIEYNNLELTDSKIYSVFDLLYKANTEERIRYLSKHSKVSEYDSENLMFGALSDILSDYPGLAVSCHTPLNMIIRNTDILTDREKEYALNPLTHLDFLIYNRTSKKPVLAIEVDGFNFHKEGTKQAERDKIKNSVLSKFDIPLIRLSTNGSREIENVREILNGQN